MKIAPAVYAKAPMMPMTTAAQGSTTEHDAVIETNPARTPLQRGSDVSQ